MLTVVRRQPRMSFVSWNDVLRVSRLARVLVAAWHSRLCEREALARLDDHLLADIGLTREAQMVECSKPFWCP